MTPILQSAPALEPVSLAEAKTWLRITHDSDDELIGALITSARLVVEARAQVVLIEQSWRIVADAWPTSVELELPIRPMIAVDGIRVADAAGAMNAMAAQDYLVGTEPLSPRIRFVAVPPAPGRAIAGIEIDLHAGFGAAAADVPEPLRQAIRLLVARWYESRGDAVSEAQSLPAHIASLVAPWRSVRLI